MPITLEQKADYKSIKGLGKIDLPDFVVLTGLNGSGKSQLLEALQNSGQGDIMVAVDEQGAIPPALIKHVTHISLAPSNVGAVDPNNLRAAAHNLSNNFQSYRDALRTKPTVTIEQTIRDANMRRILGEIAQGLGKKISELDTDEIFKYYPIDDGTVVNDIFQHNFSILFKRYHVKFEDNLIDEYRVKTYEEGDYLSRDEFKKKFGPPPWEMVNRVLEEAHVDYRLNSPEGTRRDANFSLALTNIYSEAEINFSDLSSGEKVLVSLALSLYNLNSLVDFPRVLLMDEPDAPLHPSMTQHFLDVVQRVFVEEKGVKVIMTTHSPSTIALAPEGAIYTMNKVTPRLTKSSKDSALKLLTSGVPALSVNYENRRQILVESKYDVYAYEEIYRKLGTRIADEVSLNFICPGIDGSAGSDPVRHLVTTMCEYGNPYVYGVIDWDLKNTTSGQVKVLGENKRYSIENYLFDPLILAIYLIREGHVDNSEYGLNEDEGYIDIRRFSQERLQALVDQVSQDLRQQVDDETLEDVTVSCETIDGISVDAPRWLLHFNGHQLEELVKSAWKPLRQFQNEGALKRDVIKKVVGDLPGFLSIDLLNLFRAIEGVNE